MADDARRQQQAATALIQSQGWRELVMVHVVGRVAQLDHLAVQPQLDVHMRLEAIARKDELLGIAKAMYKVAEVPNPFEVAREGLYTALVPSPTLDAPQAPSPAEPFVPPRRPRMTGTVA